MRCYFANILHSLGFALEGDFPKKNPYRRSNPPLSATLNKWL